MTSVSCKICLRQYHASIPLVPRHYDDIQGVHADITPLYLLFYDIKAKFWIFPGKFQNLTAKSCFDFFQKSHSMKLDFHLWYFEPLLAENGSGASKPDQKVEPLQYTKWTFWPNRYLQVMFSKFLGVTPLGDVLLACSWRNSGGIVARYWSGTDKILMCYWWYDCPILTRYLNVNWSYNLSLRSLIFSRVRHF